MTWADLSAVVALAFGLVTAVPGLLPAAGLALVTWSRVVSGIGWVGYSAGAMVAGVPDAVLPGVLLAQAGYGLAVVAIARQSCARDE